MVQVRYSDAFLKSTRKLPKEQQEKLASLIELLQENPFHSQLHAKHLAGKLSGLYSFRITRDWRVIFQFTSPQEIELLDVANRKDIYR
ncbi:MAG TPA: type II toxin-antitoxin system RelE/ParE family toxin [Candidatus Paceibacterota bacterium]